MPTTYNLELLNKQKADNNYAFFTAPPKVTGTSAPKCFSNVWQAVALKAGKQYQASVTVQFNAWVGTTDQVVAPGVVASTGQGMAVDIGTNIKPGSTFAMVVGSDNSPGFVPETNAGALSSFEIMVPSYTPGTPAFNIGLAQPGRDGTYLPVAVWNAEPNMDYQIEPVVKFFVTQDIAVQGQCYDFHASTLNYPTIDFSTAPGCLTATIVHNPDGLFTVDYSP